MKVDVDFQKMLREFAKNNKLSLREASREIANSVRLMNGKKIREKIIRELTF